MLVEVKPLSHLPPNGVGDRGRISVDWHVVKL